MQTGHCAHREYALAISWRAGLLAGARPPRWSCCSNGGGVKIFEEGCGAAYIRAAFHCNGALQDRLVRIPRHCDIVSLRCEGER
jgi:hypothetical protein